MKARQKGKQDSKRKLEAKYIKEAEQVIKNWGNRSYAFSGVFYA